MLARIASAIVIALAISVLARRSGSLSNGGAAAAMIIGALALLAGWSWGVLLIAYFVSSSVLSRIGQGEKLRCTASVVAKGGARDATQVLANGGVFALAALLVIVDASHGTRWAAFGAGVLAASASDTWATEIGTLAGGTPRSVIGGQPLPRGMSGGITFLGTLGAVGGAAFVALVAESLAWTTPVALAAFVGGFAGSTLDSLLGATLQARRWCDACRSGTERDVHDCGASTRHVRGLAWLSNDAVNFVSGLAGGLLALLLTG
jgi:uncharacterized protein (TIGR00297 family)